MESGRDVWVDVHGGGGGEIVMRLLRRPKRTQAGDARCARPRGYALATYSHLRQIIWIAALRMRSHCCVTTCSAPLHITSTFHIFSRTRTCSRSSSDMYMHMYMTCRHSCGMSPSTCCATGYAQHRLDAESNRHSRMCWQFSANHFLSPPALSISKPDTSTDGVE